MVRRPIVAAQPAAVHAEDHRQVLQAHIVHHLVERPLQKRRVDRAERLESLGRHPRGKDHRVLLGDPHVEVARGMLRPEEIKRRAVRHRRSNRYDLVVIVRQLHQALGKDLGVGLLPGGLGLSGLRIVWPEPVKLLLLFQRRLEAASLLGNRVQHHRLVLLLQKLERLDQQRQVVPIDRPVVAQAELFK
jgi:hypothetical protein